MSGALVLYIGALSLTAVISAAMAFIAWRRRSTPGGLPVALLMLSVAEWSLTGALEAAAIGVPVKVLWSKVEYLGIVSTPVLFLIFALQYTHQDKWRTRRNLSLLWIVPILTLVIAWTNDWHHLLWNSFTPSPSVHNIIKYGYGPWIAVHLGYSYVMVFAGAVVLIRAIVRFPHLYRQQAGALLIGSILPLVGNVVYVFANPIPGLDWTPIAFALTGLILAWTILRFRLFDLVPVARDTLIENMGSGVLVLDTQDRIVDINPAAHRMLGISATSAVGQNVQAALPDWPDVVKVDTEGSEFEIERRIVGAESCYLGLRVSPLYDPRGLLTGRLITFQDITERRRTEDRLRQLSRAVEQSPASVVITDTAGNIQYVNPRFTQLTGYSFDEAIGQNSRILKSGDTPPEEYKRMWQIIASGGEWHGEFHNRKKTGELYWESAVISPITDAQGNVAHFLAVKEDITEHKRAEEAVRQRAERLALVNEISVAINLSGELQSVLQAAVDGLTRVLNVSQSGVALFDESHRRLTLMADHPAPGAPSAVGIELPLEGNLSMQHILATRTPLAIADAHNDPLLATTHEVMRQRNIRSILLVPLIVRGAVIGTVGCDAIETPRQFTSGEIELAQTIANLVAARIEQARLFEAERLVRQQVQRRATDLSGLYAITRATSRSLALDDVLSQAISSVLLSLNFESGLIALAEPGAPSSQLRLTSSRGLSSDVLKRLQTGGLEGTLIAYIHDQHEIMLIEDIQREASAALHSMVADLEAAGWRAYAGIPLLHQEQSLGAMCLFARQPRSASSYDQVLLASTGHQIATAVANAQLFQATLSERSRLQALIEASRDGIILNSMDGYVLVINVPALQMLRLPGLLGDWIGRHLRDVLSMMRRFAPQAAKAVLSELRRLQAGDEPPAEGEFEVLPRSIHWQSLPVGLGDKPVGRLIVLRDMSDERAVERMREDMTHTMVHDLRNPLTGISTSLAIVTGGMLGQLQPNQLDMLKIAERNATRMIGLVNDILDVSRLESGRMPLKLQAFSLADLVAESLEAQSALAGENGIRLQSDVSPALPSVLADIGLIRRVLQNLIGNAIKFSPSGCFVRVEALLDEKPKQSTILVSVSDDGPGIPSEIQDRLFQKFVTGGQEGRGSGLGLAFCKLAVEAHGQHIWVDSVPGSGATFTFGLAITPGT